MESTVGIFIRELVARRQLLVLAATLAGLVVVVPLFVTFQGESVGVVRALLALGLSLGAAAILAVGLGSSTFGADISEKRFSFFFARPVSGLSIWVGRMSAVYVLIIACEMIILIPMVIFALPIPDAFQVFEMAVSDGWFHSFGFFSFFFLMPAIVLGLAHAGSVMFRARTAWIFLDLFGVMAASIASWLMLYPFIHHGFTISRDVLLWIFTWLLIVAPFAAGAIGVMVGRTDIRRTHRALSVSLWVILSLGLGVTGGFAHRLLHFGPLDLDGVEVHNVSPDGKWIVVSGIGENRLDVERSFLVSVPDGSWYSLPVEQGQEWGGARHVLFCADGNRVVWLGDGDRESPRPVWYADLTGDLVKPIETTLVADYLARISISSGGANLATVSDEILSVFTLDDQSLQSTNRIPTSLEGAAFWFTDETTVRFYTTNDYGDNRSLFIAEFDLETTRFQPTGLIPVDVDTYRLLFSHDRRYLAVAPGHRWSKAKPPWTIHDGRNGERLSQVKTQPRGFVGDLVVFTPPDEDDNENLVIQSVSGEEREFHFLRGMEYEGILGDDVVDGCYASIRASGRGARIQYLNIESGERQVLGDRLSILKYRSRPRVYYGPYGYGSYSTDSTAKNLFERDNSIYRWDRDTGELVKIAGGAG